MKFLVTGASGMIGSRLVERLAKRYGEDSVIAITSPFQTPQEKRSKGLLSKMGVRQIPVDLLNFSDLHENFSDVDVIFHLAANLGTDLRDGSEGAPIRVNDTGTDLLIRGLSDQLKGNLFIYTSSIAVVDQKWPPVMRLTEKTLCHPRTVYGKTKLRGEALIRAWSGKLGFRYVIFRLAVVYGPNCREGHIFDRFTKGVKRGALSARIDWPGKISLVYVDDVVDILIHAMDCPEMESETYFVSNSEELTVGEWLKIISKTLKKDVKFVGLPTWIVSVLNRILFQDWLWRRLPGIFAVNAWRLSLVLSNGFYCDSSKLLRICPKKYINVREGLKRIYENYTH